MSGPIQNRRVLSGMRPTGMLHLGNYHGALKNWIELQYQYECYFFIADWHALTTGYEDTSRLEEHVWTMAVDWLAAGLNPGVATLFIQSRVPEHAELHLLLSMITPLGWLERVPSYKDQQTQLSDRDLTTYGFLGYPLLQSADILLYSAQYVPVGEDQVRARRDHARDRAALQSHLRPRAAVRGKSREGDQEPRNAQLRDVSVAAQGIPGKGPHRSALEGPGAGRIQRPLDGRGPRSAVRLPRRERDCDPARTRSVAHLDAQGPGSGWAQDVEVLQQHHRLARAGGFGREKIEGHADRSCAGAPDRSRAIPTSVRYGICTRCIRMPTLRHGCNRDAGARASDASSARRP